MSKSVSYSQYSMFKNCQHQWYLTYVKGIREFKPSIHLTFGTSFHETLQNYLDVMFNVSGKQADEIDLSLYLKERMKENYVKTVSDVGNHFSNPQELTDFHTDGVMILEYFKKHRSEYFSKKNTELVGIEIPIESPVTEGVRIKGFIDFVLYHKLSDTYTIFDIKTSTKGWGDKEKKDQTKINQILLYKKYFSQLRGVPEDKIDVEFFVVKRKLPVVSEYTVKPIQEFRPANGTRKVREAFEDFTNFVNTVFDSEGNYKDQEYPKNVTRLCDWCIFGKNSELCNKKV